MNNYLEKIDSNSALKFGIVFSLLFTAIIYYADTYWFSEPELLPRPEGIAFWYKWQLSDPTWLTRASVWILYLGHQVSIWWLIYKAQEEKPTYTDGLHWFNIAALLANALFITLHLLQTGLWYDGLAQDVLEISAQWSVIVLLFMVLIMENQRRGMFFGKKIGFGDVSKSVIPKVALISKPDNGSIKSRYFMPWSCHNGYAITGSICLLAASKSKGTICSDFYSDYSDKGKFKIEHPTGMSKLSFEIEYHKNEIKNLVAGTTRHARLIMSGHVHIQKSLLNK